MKSSGPDEESGLLLCRVSPSGVRKPILLAETSRRGSGPRRARNDDRLIALPCGGAGVGSGEFGNQEFHDGAGVFFARFQAVVGTL